ncbi:DUF2065 domain-containing protein [Thermodesulfobacteriota bacterium]
MKVLIYALGIAMFFEGVPYFLFPNKSRDVARMISDMPDKVLRAIGGALVAIGFVILYFI